MVSPLDIGLLQTFQIIFPFLFVLTVVFATLTRIPPFMENALYAAIMAISLAILTMFSSIAVKTINLMAPWFVLLFVAITFLWISYRMIGYSEKQLMASITESQENSSAIGVWVLAIILIIALGSLATVISEERGFTALTGAQNATKVLTSASGESAGFFTVLLNPKVLGMAVILLIAFIAIGQLSKASTK